LKRLRDIIDQIEDTVKVLRSFYLYASIKPQAKQSVAFGKGHGFTPPKKRAYLKNLGKKLAESYPTQMKVCGLVRLTVLLSFPWRETDCKSLLWALMEESPDVDNLYKPVADSLQEICLKNDSQVVSIRVQKIRSEDVGILVKVEEVMANRAIQLG
jgi:Holliday junction resolvase RusA-like endonuclease